MSNSLGKPQEKLHKSLGDKGSGREIELDVQQFGAMDSLDEHCPSVMVDARVLQRSTRSHTQGRDLGALFDC
jgi:hypothetical protein